MKNKLLKPLCLFLVIASLNAQDNISAQKPVLVTVDNFSRAETDLVFASVALKQSAFGKLAHHRQQVSINQQTAVRTNFDVLVSDGVFDLDSAPLTITLPDSGKRFMSLLVINEDHYTPVIAYKAGSYTLSKEQAGSRYVLVLIRTLANMNDKSDMEKAHNLQDAIKTTQQSIGNFTVPQWDESSRAKVRDALKILGGMLPDMSRMFGTKEQVDPVRHLIGTATGWGGNNEKDAMYLYVTPEKNDGKTAYTLTIKEVPVDGFWSIALYNAEGYFQQNASNSYTVNSVMAKKNADNSITIHFGGCDNKEVNCLPIMPNWNYLVRLYRPRAEILDGSWKFPQAKPVQ